MSKAESLSNSVEIHQTGGAEGEGGLDSGRFQPWFLSPSERTAKSGQRRFNKTE